MNGFGQSDFGASSRGNSGFGASGGSDAGMRRSGSRTDGGRRGDFDATGMQAGNRGGAGRSGDRFSTPSQNQLNSFLGLPSDSGLQGLGAGNRTAATRSPERGSNLDINYGTKQGDRGGQAAGIAVTGPQGNTAGRAVGVGAEGGAATASGVRGAEGNAAGRATAVGPEGGVASVGGIRGSEGGAAARGAAVGPDGGVAAARGARGSEGGVAARGAAVGPDGRAVAAGGVRGPGGYGAGRAVAVGPQGVAAGFTRVSPSARYTTAVSVRNGYSHWDLYGRGWYNRYPGAWYAAGWVAGSAWTACSWNSAAAYFGYGNVTPIYYDYGQTVVYQGDNVYINGQDVGTSDQYYDQATELAEAGAESKPDSDTQWLPLGVFALTQSGKQQSNVTLQLAVNKEGVIRGNYTDTATDKNQVIQGSVDKKTQRVAFTVGDNTNDVVETGLYNLTKDEAPCLIHFGNEKTEQWLLVRLEQNDPSGSGSDAGSSQ
ncbi:protocadherin [Roseiconus nitratireducens]|uniref:Protocadherin n=2 Tax=Roseiconus nitratireducens TaxID=2605748 RepID=A0A5M6CVD6_9BACT|nr:protocadherin [Roseiconus nitratireducens]